MKTTDTKATRDAAPDSLWEGVMVEVDQLGAQVGTRTVCGSVVGVFAAK